MVPRLWHKAGLLPESGFGAAVSLNYHRHKNHFLFFAKSSSLPVKLNEVDAVVFYLIDVRLEHVATFELQHYDNTLPK